MTTLGLKRLVPHPIMCSQVLAPHKGYTAAVHCEEKAAYVLHTHTSRDDLKETFFCAHCVINELLERNAELEKQLEVVREAQELAVKHR